MKRDQENLIQNLSDFNTVTSAAKTILAPGVIGYNIVKANSQHSDGVVQQAVKKSDLGSIYDIVSG